MFVFRLRVNHNIFSTWWESPWRLPFHDACAWNSSFAFYRLVRTSLKITAIKSSLGLLSVSGNSVKYLKRNLKSATSRHHLPDCVHPARATHIPALPRLFWELDRQPQFPSPTWPEFPLILLPPAEDCQQQPTVKLVVKKLLWRQKLLLLFLLLLVLLGCSRRVAQMWRFLQLHQSILALRV